MHTSRVKEKLAVVPVANNIVVFVFILGTKENEVMTSVHEH